VQALPANGLSQVPTNVVVDDVNYDPAVFTEQLAGALVVVIPLLARGTTAGQSVLLQALQHGKAVIATRHPALTDYLGPDYPGYVRAEDPDDLAARIRRVIEDDDFRAGLADWVERCREKIHALRPYHVELDELVERSTR
jgi:glycosyltransferase involved in cell wall biosynthesis